MVAERVLSPLREADAEGVSCGIEIFRWYLVGEIVPADEARLPLVMRWQDLMRCFELNARPRLRWR